MMKERFTVSMDDDLMVWLDKMVEEKIFLNRSHAVEFCVKQFSTVPIQDIILLHWARGKKEPVFLTDTQIKKLTTIMRGHGFTTKEEATEYVVNNFKEEGNTLNNTSKK